MKEINLLARCVVRRQNRKKSFFWFFMIVLFVIGLSYYRPAKKIQPVLSSPVHKENLSRPPLKWVGYLHDNSRMIGLIKLPKGVIQEVEIGSIIDVNQLVVSMDESGVVVINNGKKEKISDAT